MSTYVPLLLLLVLLATFSITAALNGGFSVELIHRDSAKSPFYNSTETPFQQMAKALHRSMKRVNHFYSAVKNSPDAAQSEISHSNGDYLMSYSIGTPPFKIIGSVDTGSDLIWSQCKPCNVCYNQTAPMFDPSKSKTYKSIPCSSKQCIYSDCNSTRKSICEYNIKYGDGSYSKGTVALDTLTLGSTSGQPVSFPNIIIGCGHNNDGAFDPSGSGIVGLGGGAASLISQLRSSIGDKFSYCLVSYLEPNSTSKLNFGENAVVSGSRTVSTPIAPDWYTFYFLTLEGMSVGEKRLEFVGEPTSTNANGNIIIDSGTTLTYLLEEFYTKLESEVASQIKLERVQDPKQLLNLCYKSTSVTIEAPIITAHFTGADIKMNSLNTFASFSKGVVCFAFSPGASGAIFGNLAQMNFLIGYDLQKKIVSFKPADCTKM